MCIFEWIALNSLIYGKHEDHVDGIYDYQSKHYEVWSVKVPVESVVAKQAEDYKI